MQEGEQWEIWLKLSPRDNLLEVRHSCHSDLIKFETFLHSLVRPSFICCCVKNRVWGDSCLQSLKSQSHSCRQSQCPESILDEFKAFWPQNQREMCYSHTEVDSGKTLKHLLCVPSSLSLSSACSCMWETSWMCLKASWRATSPPWTRQGPWLQSSCRWKSWWMSPKVKLSLHRLLFHSGGSPPHKKGQLQMQLLVMFYKEGRYLWCVYSTIFLFPVTHRIETINTEREDYAGNKVYQGYVWLTWKRNISNILFT